MDWIPDASVGTGGVQLPNGDEVVMSAGQVKLGITPSVPFLGELKYKMT